MEMDVITIKTEITDAVSEAKEPRENCCEQCGKAFLNKNSFKKHKLTYNKMILPCDECGKTFSRKSCLEQHTRLHSGDNLHYCETCFDAFPTRDQLESHEVSHSTDRPHIKCRKAFKRKNALIQHIQSSHENKRYQCEQCDKSFTSNQHLKFHQNLHAGKLFSCDQCGKKYWSNLSLRRHHRVHTRAKPFTCDLCGTSFSQSGVFKSHKLMHTGGKKQQKEQKPHTFGPSLDQIPLKHLEVRLQRVQTCDQVYRPDVLKSHLLSRATERHREATRHNIPRHNSIQKEAVESSTKILLKCLEIQLQRVRMCNQIHDKPDALKSHLLSHTEEEQQKETGHKTWKYPEIRLHRVQT